MKRVYICSPLKGDIDGNRACAEQYCRYAVSNGYIPYAPHIYFSRFLDDNRHDARNIAFDEGLRWLSACDEVWVFGDLISEGMKSEIEHAEMWGISVRYFSGSSGV